MSISLAKLIVPSKTVWADYPGLPDFKVQVAYLTRDELMKMRKKTLSNKVNKKTREIDEVVDSELFQTLYVQGVIKDWTGLKYKYLPKLVPTDISGENEEDELPFSLENAETLMRNATEFDSWITSLLEDVENFTVAS